MSVCFCFSLSLSHSQYLSVVVLLCGLFNLHAIWPTCQVKWWMDVSDRRGLGERLQQQSAGRGRDLPPFAFPLPSPSLQRPFPIPSSHSSSPHFHSQYTILHSSSIWSDLILICSSVPIPPSFILYYSWSFPDCLCRLIAANFQCITIRHSTFCFCISILQSQLECSAENLHFLMALSLAFDSFNRSNDLVRRGEERISEPQQLEERGGERWCWD